jgi:hypothetical protein
MRILETARTLARIAGIGAAWRYLKGAGRIALAAELDTLAAYIQLLRHRALSKSRHNRKEH